MQLSEFGYDLPPERIATAPARPRDAARLLHVEADGLHDQIVRDLPALLRPDDLLVVNDTKVIPAQLTARRGDAKIGITLDRRLDDGSWHVLLRNSKRVKQGDVLVIDPAFSAEVVELEAGGAAILRFTADDFHAALERSGALALPPYIARPEGITAQDKTDYQTLFAAHEGAVAAPTAGLHFTPTLLAALQARGVEMAKVTLHVGAGTFLPVRVERIEDHKMHAERGYITEATAARINAAKAAGRRIIPIGTTALRLLESAATDAGTLKPFDSETDIFIYPGYRFKIADALFTNFHLPHSTLLMLVSAFAGTKRIKAAYAHAIANGYRFYSYGDACLLERAAG
ncbi:tRNA preQ1(34) S-adenosylmethionine ribosyltransferase-isomerase QueA [Acidocella aminolytica]|jgi:S-adenosylmethionine:tRNA ribosyltransferase-isomerase|uniref:S-adenosylmethionine:tRNA ribosyltransferase-isomerase n=1 Tax=Acidocella aminolytica 101 = DSM 11237 TaxID=1120923 RepID=A0A0D6PK06_9PROT|nr:tRNA preQ1(34) S-adenosylmethionine ribosyltransferase-isomerase QueA [Acidocella aminolytica]GAN82022.1 S-adenosylmethionine:tRNA ribosyltransferase-isomerase [Acidocella aminolytica 101 = DSM 11237]GBQ32114.1 S-adenosylmethionine:tRNA ribosyltransferase-isomerase [Acidocella aminolytica 101 = DSM 11237]SHE97203.1 S-adenosylmethionine:tRNA ribosyltransferase-isomerase [Acidocella aminolytica 101 = DSM 11237]